MKAFKKVQNHFNKQAKAVAGKITDNTKKKINLAKSVVTNPKEFVDKLKYGNYDDLPYSFREMLHKIGDQKINSLEIVRNPISSALMNLMNGLSGFTLKQKMKETPYDNLFHLKLRINNSYDLEKEANVKLGKKVNATGQESLQISEIPNITIRDFIENTINNMGIKNFTHYDGKNNNCQVFVLKLLHSNNINNTNYDNFIKQNTEFVFKNNPNPLFKKIMDTATDLGERVNTLTEGTGLSKSLQRKGTLTNYDIANICKALNLHINMICMKDELNLNNLTNGNYIMNLENHNQGGSHWVAFVKRKKEIYYSDSFGVICPQNEYHLFMAEHEKLHYNKTQIQDIKSKCCGWFAIAYILFMNKANGTLQARSNKYIACFDLKKLKDNDKIVKQIINDPVKYLK